MRTGVIGLGAMGGAMAANLHRAGCLGAVWNRTPAKADEFARRYPVTVAADPAALAAQCELIIISVARDEHVLHIIDALRAGLRASSIVIDTSTVAVATARHAATQVQQSGAAFLDAPVTGGLEGAQNASLTMMVGGDEGALQRARPVLEHIAGKIVHVGGAGSGQATKAVNQIMAAGINQAVTEALAFGQALGLPMDKVLEIIGAGAAGNWFLEHRGASMLRDQYTPGFKVALHHKDLMLCKAAAEQLGAQLPIVEMTLLHYQRLIQAGHAEQDISALFKLKQGLFVKKT